MRLCFVADARSPIARNWIQFFVANGHEVHVVSTYPCDTTGLGIQSIHMIPVGFSEMAGGGMADGSHAGFVGGLRSMVARMTKHATLKSALHGLRHWVGPLELHRNTARLRDLINQIQPDLVHAMRIPYEGLLAAEALREQSVPLLISVWGNDFTLHANRFPLLAYFTKRAMRRADAIHPDCFRDLHLARHWGFSPSRPALVVPGSGGVQTDVFRPGPAPAHLLDRFQIPGGAPVVLNPRGAREYVRNDTFFRAIPLVLEHRPDVIFACAAMADNASAHRWVQKLGIGSSVRLLPKVARADMADLFRMANILVSPSEHDGTPNTLIEGMACGAFPLAGDIESIREWIDHGINGLLFDPSSPTQLADALLKALDDTALRERAFTRNLQLCAERADYNKVMPQAAAFYHTLCVP